MFIQPYTLSCPADLTVGHGRHMGKGWLPGAGTSGKIKTLTEKAGPASLVFFHIPWLSFTLGKFSQLMLPQQQRRFQCTETVKYVPCRGKAAEMNAICFLRKYGSFKTNVRTATPPEAPVCTSGRLTGMDGGVLTEHLLHALLNSTLIIWPERHRGLHQVAYPR